ncbi:MAG: response regulator transcription factor [Dehalococcoidales bacterium]|nr:response regulator transcription factor [Dehalococcoidales bacterium]
MKVLLIGHEAETEQNICLSLQLRWPGITVITTNNARNGIDWVETEQPDIIILEYDNPDINGLRILSDVRLFSEIPIIALSASIDTMDKIKALETGADDWIGKPFNHMELLAKVNAVLRRYGTVQFHQYATSFISSKLTINFTNREVCVSGNPVKLTPTEYKLLCCLVKNEGKAVPHHRLLDNVWGSGYTDDISFLKKYVYRLRSKVEDNHQNPQMIVTEWGVGYKFVKPVSVF